MQSTAIIGAGMLGMTLALRLANAGRAVTIFEAASDCGGLAAPWELGGVTWDRHYHVTLYSDGALRALLDELGLTTHLRWVTTRTGFYTNGSMYPFSGIADFLRFPPLSPLQKLRLGMAIARTSRIAEWRELESVTAVDWLTKQCGPKTVETIWLPLLRAKLGAYAEEASAAFIWAIIARMYGARRSGMKRELFGYVEGGYDRILDTFERHLEGAGVRIRTSTRVARVEPAGDGVAIAYGAGTERFDEAVVTLAAPLAAAICPALPAGERAALSAIGYQGIVCASLLMQKPLSPYYITNITDRSIPFTAVIEMTALVDPSAFQGRSLVYLPKYAPAGDPVFRLDDVQLQEQFFGALERMHPAFSRRDVLAFRVSRVPCVFPLPSLNYSQRLPPQRTGMPGLYLAGSAHVVNGTLNVNESVMLANATARLVLDARSPRIAAGAA